MDQIDYRHPDAARRGERALYRYGRFGQSLSGLPDGEYVVLQFYTTFAEKGLALETITLTKAQDDAWQIAAYEIK